MFLGSATSTRAAAARAREAGIRSFSPENMDIIRRYGVAGLMAGGGAAVLGGQGGGTKQ